MIIPRVALVVWVAGVTMHAGGAEPDAAHVLKTLRPGHPRLMLLDDRLQHLKAAHATDATLRTYAEQVEQQADAALGKPPLEHKLIGPRLLTVSRECLDRIYALALAWRWTGDRKYAEAAESNLLTVCAFPDWNPSHFLDTAEMSHAVGIGYDWLFGYLSEASRATIKAALITKGLEPGIAVYKRGTGWPQSDFNWNQVCNGGMIIGALAIAETDPEYAEFIVPNAVRSLPRALASYDPDGAWMEGPAYWHYATRYTAYGLCALDTALGTDFGLSDRPGLRVTGHFPTFATGPTGLLVNYADSGERSARKPMPCMFWLAEKYGDPAVSDAEHAVLANGRADAAHLVWYQPPSNTQHAPLPLDKWFRSSVDIVVMRSAWNDPNALFVGVKGGYNQVNHGHLDLGNFELDALGERWARDLGSDDYNLPGYWDKKKGGKRWSYYRLATASHNVPMLNGREQDEEAKAVITDFSSREDEVRVAIDLTTAYAPLSSKTTREVLLTANRTEVLVRDRFELDEPCDVVWGMTTDAEIIVEGTTARLRIGEKKLIARIIEPAQAVFEVGSAEQSPPQKTNAGVKRLLARVEQAKGPLQITISLSPVVELARVSSTP